MDRLAPLDASFLHIEDAGTHMHIGAVAVLDGPAPRRAELMRLVESKLPEIPRYRQTVRVPSLHLGPPVWVDDPSFELFRHIRATTLRRPGDDDALRALVGRVMSSPLDRSRPLWEMWVVNGFADGRWALIAKVHHAMVDGVSGAELLEVLLDEDPGAVVAQPIAWKPERQPGGAELAVRALGHRGASFAYPARAMAAALATPRTSAAVSAATVRGLVALAGVLKPRPPTSLNGPVGRARHWSWASAQLADIKAIRAAFGGTVNDVVLAVIAGGLRELLLARGEACRRPVRTLVPVSLRGDGEHHGSGNRVTALFAELPIDVDEPLERLARVRAGTLRLKAAHEALGTELLLELSHVLPDAVFGRALGAASRREQHLVATVATNVPGPKRPLYVSDRRVLELVPYVPLAAHVRTGIAILSYDGRISFGVTAVGDDPDDLGVLTAAIERDVARLTADARAEVVAS